MPFLILHCSFSLPRLCTLSCFLSLSLSLSRKKGATLLPYKYSSNYRTIVNQQLLPAPTDTPTRNSSCIPTKQHGKGHKEDAYSTTKPTIHNPRHMDPYSKWQVPAVRAFFPRIVQYRWDTSRWKYGGRKVVEVGPTSQRSHWCTWNSIGPGVCPFSVGKGRKKEEEEEEERMRWVHPSEWCT